MVESAFHPSETDKMTASKGWVSDLKISRICVEPTLHTGAIYTKEERWCHLQIRS